MAKPSAVRQGSMTLVKAVTTTNDLTVLVALRECSMPMLRDGSLSWPYAPACYATLRCWPYPQRESGPRWRLVNVLGDLTVGQVVDGQ